MAKYNVPFPLEASLPNDWRRAASMATRSPGRRNRCATTSPREIEAAGANYFVCDFAFGAISHDDALRSAELFANEVMPAFA